METATRLRVMTWNVWWHFGAAWRDRQVALRAILEEIRPDVVGLQEVWGQADGGANQAHELGTALDMESAFAAPSLPPPPAAAVGQEVGVGLLSRWPIERTEVHRLPSFHREEVVMLAAEIQHPFAPLHAIVTCTDYDEAAGDERLAQTAALVAQAADPARDGALPVLAMGDLNAPPETPEIRVLARAMTDTWVAANGAEAAGVTLRSDNPFRPEGAWQLDHRIDYIFARPGTDAAPLVVEAARVVDEPREGIHPSDHAAVVIDLLVPA